MTIKKLSTARVSILKNQLNEHNFVFTLVSLFFPKFMYQMHLSFLPFLIISDIVYIPEIDNTDMTTQVFPEAEGQFRMHFKLK